MLYYPRTKPDGGGPGLKSIKKSSDMAPGYYKVKRTLTERKSHHFKFANKKNQNCFEQYIKSKEFVPGVGKYKEIDKGIALQSRPNSVGPRRRLG
mmetsp:Transcript_634/g.1012  ORF Transcript_634/g.1012 Transcript_634/m.1012 type:complete len:95 (-) Transcript_634:318-602(-)